ADALHDLEAPPHAVTDVTGFGLLGHAWEVAERSGVVVELDAGALRFYDGALAAAEAGVRTGGDTRNRAHLEGRVTCDAPAAVEGAVGAACGHQTTDRRGTFLNMARQTVPSLALEKGLWAEGHGVVVGMDEVGRGAWAGPISVGAAVLPRDRRVYKVRDSKML